MVRHVRHGARIRGPASRNGFQPRPVRTAPILRCSAVPIFASSIPRTFRAISVTRHASESATCCGIASSHGSASNLASCSGLICWRSKSPSGHHFAPARYAGRPRRTVGRGRGAARRYRLRRPSPARTPPASLITQIGRLVRRADEDALSAARSFPSGHSSVEIARRVAR